MDLVLKKGRPENLNGRLPKEIRCYDFLDGLHIEYYCVDHRDMVANTMEACQAIDAALGCTICKNLFLCNRQKTLFYLLCAIRHKFCETCYLVNFSFSMISSSWRRICAFSSPSSMWS